MGIDKTVQPKTDVDGEIATFQTAQAVWKKWRALLCSTADGPYVHAMLEAASSREASSIAERNVEDSSIRERVKSLYDALALPAPKNITWYGSESINEIDDIPIYHVRDMLLFSGFGKICCRSPVTGRVFGYDWVTGDFHLSLNKTHIFETNSRARVPWRRNFANLFCRFDVDALAILETAKKLGLSVNADTVKLADAAEQLLQVVFGALLFRDTCLLVRIPHLITVDEHHQLQASFPDPAFRGVDHKVVFVRNGQKFHWPYGARPRLEQIVGFLNEARSGRNLFARMEFIGWANLLDMVRKEKKKQRQSLLHNGMFANFNIGFELRPIDSHPRWGKLWGLSYRNNQFLLLEVKNRTPDDKGEFSTHVLHIDRSCRPLPRPNNPRSTFGEPQELTALNAVASTWGMTGEEYERIIGKES